MNLLFKCILFKLNKFFILFEIYEISSRFQGFSIYELIESADTYDDCLLGYPCNLKILFKLYNILEKCFFYRNFILLLDFNVLSYVEEDFWRTGNCCTKYKYFLFLNFENLNLNFVHNELKNDLQNNKSFI